MTWTVEFTEVEARPIVGLRQRVDFATDDLTPIIRRLYDEVYGRLPADAGRRPGHNVIAYFPVGDTTADMLAGLDWAGEVPDGLETFELPAGVVAHARHVGTYDQLSRVHETIRAWQEEHGQREVLLNWEVYGHWSDDPSKLETDVYHARRV